MCIKYTQSEAFAHINMYIDKFGKNRKFLII
jgi:hypothetical protein